MQDNNAGKKKALVQTRITGVPKNNPKLKNLISRNDKIYSKSLKYISKPPKDLDLIQVFPSQELECGVLINSIEHIRNDYHYGLEIGLDTISKLSSS